jgi:hypothetical protein
MEFEQEGRERRAPPHSAVASSRPVKAPAVPGQLSDRDERGGGSRISTGRSSRTDRPTREKPARNFGGNIFFLTGKVLT